MIRGHWPTYLVIAGLVSVGLACLMALGLQQPLQEFAVARAPGAHSQARNAPLHNGVDPVEAVDAVTARLLSTSGS